MNISQNPYEYSVSRFSAELAELTIGTWASMRLLSCQGTSMCAPHRTAMVFGSKKSRLDIRSGGSARQSWIVASAKSCRMAGKPELDNPIRKDNDSFRLARIDVFVRPPLFSHENNSVSSLHAQYLDEIDARNDEENLNSAKILYYRDARIKKN
jgi:hypothetical protein